MSPIGSKFHPFTSQEAESKQFQRVQGADTALMGGTIK